MAITTAGVSHGVGQEQAGELTAYVFTTPDYQVALDRRPKQIDGQVNAAHQLRPPGAAATARQPTT
jgi:hypothetical protein